MSQDGEEKKFATIVDLIVESWRLNRFTKNLADNIDSPKVKKKSVNQIKRFEQYFQAALDAYNLNVVDFTGEKYDPGLPILPINLGDFNADDELMIEMMIEPTVKIADTAEIVRKGAAVLKAISGQ